MQVNSPASNPFQTSQPPRQEANPVVQPQATQPSEEGQTRTLSSNEVTTQSTDPNQRVGSIVDIQV